MGKHGKAEDKVYQLICSNPGLNTYQISKKLKMSGGNVRNALYNLYRKGLILFEVEKSVRVKKKCFAVKISELLPYTIKRKIKTFRVPQTQK